MHVDTFNTNTTFNIIADSPVYPPPPPLRGAGVTDMFFMLLNCVLVSIVWSLRDREVSCSASDRQGSNFESCVWRTVSSQSFHHPQDVLQRWPKA